MIGRILSLGVVAVITAVLFYVSRFWDFRLWGRDGLFGVEELRPAGGLLARWLRGTDLAPFELVIWGIGAVLILSLLQKIFDSLGRPNKGQDEEG